MITRATVIKTEGDMAYVRAFRKSACEGCDGCSDKGKCHAEIMLSETPKEYELKVVNKICAKTGDVVEIQTSGNFVLLFAFAIFVLPIIMAVASYFVSENLGFGFNSVVVSVVAFSVSFAVLAFCANKLISKFSTNSICKIIKENSGVAV